MHGTHALRWLPCVLLGACIGHAPTSAADRTATSATSVIAVTSAAKPAEPPAPVDASAPNETPLPPEPLAILQPDEHPVAPVGEAKPTEIPETRPRTIEAARLHLLAISEDGDLSNLAALADPKFGLEFVYRSEGKRARRSRLPLDRTRLLAEFGDRVPWRPQMYVATMNEGFEPADVKVDPAKLTVAFAPGGYYGLDFVFKRSGEALVLTQISAWDVEP